MDELFEQLMMAIIADMNLVRHQAAQQHTVPFLLAVRTGIDSSTFEDMPIEIPLKEDMLLAIWRTILDNIGDGVVVRNDGDEYYVNVKTDNYFVRYTKDGIQRLSVLLKNRASLGGMYLIKLVCSILRQLDAIGADLKLHPDWKFCFLQHLDMTLSKVGEVAVAGSHYLVEIAVSDTNILILSAESVVE